ncbi:MAG TPA: hypothetical protein VM598_07975 [Bdellovibrionota bacterium]|nr:hypothetical protein [Bdellovibrionota bacterium]
MKTLLAAFVLLFSAAPALAAEPAYCSLSELMKHRIPYDRSGIKNQQVFRFGALHLAGLAVGESKTSQVIAMSDEFSDTDRAQKYCTWYLNDGNDQAARAFNWFNVERPNGDIQGSVRHYRDVLKGVFADNAINMLDCAVRHHYLALGCDGMKHRGPTVFGMLLAYSGCTPKKAAEIVNTIWGLNTVPAASRLAVIEEGYRMGTANPAARQQLQDAFSQQ